ncbi:MAG: class I SAM-dependent methyltransferase [Sneathiella sp.]
MNKIHSLPPVLVALVVQLVTYLLLSQIHSVAQSHLNYAMPFFGLMVIQGGLASFITYLLKFPYWWILIQLIAPPLLVLALALSLPFWVLPVVLVVMVTVFWNVAIDRVPLYLTNEKTALELSKRLPKRAGLKIVDLGSGLGGTMRLLAQHRPNQQFIGFEGALMPFLLSWIFAKFGKGANIRFRFKNFWRLDLSDFDVVYCFLSPVPMADLYAKAKREMKPGSLFISNSFTVPDVPPSRTISVKDGRKTKLLVWEF